MLSLVETLGPLLASLVGKFIDSDETKAQVQQQIEAALLGYQQSMNDAAGRVMEADANSQSWLTRNARPMVVLWTLSIITILTFSPLMGTGLQHELLASLKGIPGDLWDVVKVGIGGYMLARSADKAINAYASK